MTFRATATDIGNMQNIGKDRTCTSGDMLADRQTHTQTDTVITILRSPNRGRSDNVEQIEGSFCVKKQVDLSRRFCRTPSCDWQLTDIQAYRHRATSNIAVA